MNASTRKANRIRKARRNGTEGMHTMSGHCIESGLSAEMASGVGNALHSKAKSLGLAPVVCRTRKSTTGRLKTRRTVNRYTRSQFLAALDAYSPRGVKQIEAKALMLAA